MGGALLGCMIWPGMLVYAFDRRWPLAAVFALLGALASFFGIIHNDGINMFTLLDGSLTDGTMMSDGSGEVPVPYYAKLDAVPRLQPSVIVQQIWDSAVCPRGSALPVRRGSGCSSHVGIT